ncbi:MAG: nucleotidyl transferase AbiEii/AbiGii toxin family protein [Pirellulales bacterium]
MIDRAFIEATTLLLRIVPRVFATDRLALKGGTAINLYLDDAPRLSVDLDLVFTQLGLPRQDALSAINDEMRRIVAALTADGLDARPAVTAELGETGLVISDGTTQVKVETNIVFRGTLLPPSTRTLSAGAAEWPGMDAQATVVDRSEVFAGKFMAALDRQHPRDLYDVWRLYQRGPIESGMLSAFVIYLCGHNRPAHEILNSPDRVLPEDYDRALVGMIRGEVPSLEDLIESRSRLRRDILQGLAESDRAFLAGFFACEPDWSLLVHSHANDLPALAWKQQNLVIFRSRRPDEFAQQYAALVTLLF